MKKLVTAVVLALLLGGSYFYVSHGSQAGEPQTKGRKSMAIPVTTGIVQSHEVSRHLSLISKLDAAQSVELSAQVTAKIASIGMNSNSQVMKGQTLIQFDAGKEQAAYDEAFAYLHDEKRKLAEFQRLISKGAINKTEYASQQAKVTIAQARLEAAKAVVDEHAIRAPFTGHVGLFRLAKGQTVKAGDALVGLDDLRTMQLDIHVPEQYLALLAVGMTVNATSQAWPDTVFTGKVEAIDSRVQTESLNIKVRVVFDNAKGQLKPGMLMAANVNFPPQKAAVIPVQALEYDGTHRYVYVVGDDHVAKRTAVSLGERLNDKVVIESGVRMGDRIVIQGLVNMRDGRKVNELSSTFVNRAETAKTESKS